MNNKNMMLMILDGFGINEREQGNAIKMANTPNLDRLMKTYPTSTIATSGRSVGLDDGQMGNSEVGHINIGAGRVVFQESTKITKSIEDGDDELAARLQEIGQSTVAITDRKSVV